jgi:hypothetical protein
LAGVFDVLLGGALVSTGVEWAHPRATRGIAAATHRKRRTACALNSGENFRPFEGFIVDVYASRAFSTRLAVLSHLQTC